MKHSIEHDLTPEQLRLAVGKFAEAYCQRFAHYQARAVWLGPDQLEVRFAVKGVRLSGTLCLMPHEISIEMQVPLAFRLFKGRALKAIEEEVGPWLARARAEPL